MAALSRGAAAEEDFPEWLCTELEALGLDGEVFREYVEGILSDDTDPLLARAESAVEILRGAAEHDVAEDFPAQLCARWEAKLSSDSDALASESAQMAAVLAEKQKQDLELAAQGEEARRAQAAKGNGMSRDQRLAREKLLHQYGFAESAIDEDGNVIDKTATNPSAADELSKAGLGGGANDNRCRVKDAERVKVSCKCAPLAPAWFHFPTRRTPACCPLQRESAKAAHAAQVERNKQQQQQEKERKEKEKRRTQRRERRR